MLQTYYTNNNKHLSENNGSINRLNPCNILVPTINIITPQEIRRIQEESQRELCEAAKAAYLQDKTVIIDVLCHIKNAI